MQILFCGYHWLIFFSGFLFLFVFSVPNCFVVFLVFVIYKVELLMRDETGRNVRYIACLHGCFAA
jgi:hypothetical protein